MKRIAMTCRFDNSGVGTLSWEFARHLKPAKVLLVENHVNQVFPERYADSPNRKADRMTPELMDWFLTDVDVFFAIETPYDWGIVKECRKRGIKTVLYTMFEMTADPIPMSFDLYLCPSKLDLEYFEGNKVYLPVPLAEDRLLWTKRTKAKTFIHTASHGGMDGRKGTQVLLDAIPMVKAQDIEFRIYTWKSNFRIPNDPRVRLQVVNFKNYWQMWREGDVLIYPQGANGICLPIVEAMASGMGVLTTDIYPFNEYMPKEMLFKPCETYRHRMAPRLVEVEDYKIDPKDIAAKIDEWAGKDISKFSLYGKKYGQEHSFKKLLPEYLEVFNSL